MLLHDLRRAVMFREAGACYEDAEGMVWHRAEWRVRDGIVDPDQMEEALGLLQAIIELGMELRVEPRLARPQLRTRPR